MTGSPDTHPLGTTALVATDEEVTLLQSARSQAAEAAARARVRVRPLHGIDDMRAAAEVLDEIWGTDQSNPQLDPRLMVAIEEAGGYVVGVTDEADLLVGAAVGFPRQPEGLHSHIAGVLPQSALRGVGTAVKLHQRAWCLERGMRSVTWTFDPLVSRNAHLNLVTLGARVEHYLVDVYGPMRDALNRGDPSDRLLVRWPLASASRQDLQASGPRVIREGDDGAPVFSPAPSHEETLLVAVPRDIENLRRSDPAVALQWRMSVRQALLAALAEGREIVGFDAANNYVIGARP